MTVLFNSGPRPAGRQLRVFDGTRHANDSLPVTEPLEFSDILHPALPAEPLSRRQHPVNETHDTC
jgi:hypothetical protein